MIAPRTLLYFALAAAAISSWPAAAQGTDSIVVNLAPAPGTSQGSQPWGRPYLGLNVGRARYSLGCATNSILCDDRERPTQFVAGTMIGSFWGAEVGYLSNSRRMPDGMDNRMQGLNLSVVGRARLGSSIGIFGKVGTTYLRSESPTLMVSDQGFGLSFGGGVSYDFTPRLSARIEWDSNDFRFANGRDPVRSTSLGLQYRY